MAMNDDALVALVDEALLTLDDLCRAGAVAPDWVAERVQAGLLVARPANAARLALRRRGPEARALHGARWSGTSTPCPNWRRWWPTCRPRSTSCGAGWPAPASAEPGPAMKPNPKTQWNVGYWLLALMALVWLQSLWQAQRQVEPVPYSVFEQALADGRVAEVWSAKPPSPASSRTPTGGKTMIVANRVEPDLAERLSRYDVPYTRVVESTLLRDVLSWVVPAAVFFGLWFFVVRRMADKQGGWAAS